MDNTIQKEFRKHNTLIEGKYKFGLVEIKTLLLIISKVSMDDTTETSYRVKWGVFKKLSNKIDTSQKILDLCSRLKNKDVIIKKDDNTLSLFGFISGVEITNGKYVDFYITPQVRDLYIKLLKRGNFTLLDMECISNLPSKHSVRMYEIMKSQKWKNQPVILELDRLKWMLDIENKYRDFSLVRHNVLEKSRKDLRKYTDITFTYKPIKTGRKITHISFRIKDNPSYQSTIFSELEKQRIVKEEKTQQKEIPFNYTLYIDNTKEWFYNQTPDKQQDVINGFEKHLSTTDKLTYSYVKTKYNTLPSPDKLFIQGDLVDLWVSYLVSVWDDDKSTTC